jgi:hypothetical protein
VGITTNDSAQCLAPKPGCPALHPPHSSFTPHPYLEGGEQGSQVGELLLKGLVLLFILAEEGAGCLVSRRLLPNSPSRV